MLINSVVDKIPTQHRLNWAFYKRMIGDTHIGHLGDFLHEIADVASQVLRGDSSSAESPNKKKTTKTKSSRRERKRQNQIRL